jgi:hypothetical protein
MDFFALTLERVGAGVGVDKRVLINCLKVVSSGYAYSSVTIYLFNDDQKITTNPSD